MTEPLATVVLVNFNGAALLGPCLTALREQTMPGAAYEVWVVDNASADGSLELLRRDFPEVRLLASAVNRGFAGGNNLALRQVRTPYAVLLNTDTVVEPGWLEALLAPFDSPDGARVAAVTSKIVFLPRFVHFNFETAPYRPGGPDPRELGVRVHDITVAGAPVLDRVLWERSSYGPERVGDLRFHWTRPLGSILLPAPPGDVALSITWAADRDKTVRLGPWELPVGPQPQTVSVTLPAGVPRVDVVNNVGGLVFADGYGADRGYQEVDDGQFDEPVEVFFGCGAAVALRTAAGGAADWFDDDFFLYYEDTDLGWRLRSAGWTARYEPKAVVRHIHSATSQEFSPLWQFHVDRNRLLMLTKNATAGLATRQFLRYLVTTASMLVRALRQRSRPGLGQVRLRLRVVRSYLGLLPRMLTARRAVGATAVVRRRALQEQWLAPR